MQYVQSLFSFAAGSCSTGSTQVVRLCNGRRVFDADGGLSGFLAPLDGLAALGGLAALVGLAPLDGLAALVGREPVYRLKYK